MLLDAWRTQTWRGLTKFFMLGSHIQAAAVELALQEGVLPPEAGLSSSKLSQGSAELQDGSAEEHQKVSGEELQESMTG